MIRLPFTLKSIDGFLVTKNLFLRVSSVPMVGDRKMNYFHATHSCIEHFRLNHILITIEKILIVAKRNSINHNV